MKLLLLVSALGIAAPVVAQGYRYEVTDLTALYGLAASADITDMNSAGTMVGAQLDYGFVIEDGEFSVLERPKGAVDYFALAVNDNGVILGTGSFAGGPDRSIIWVNGKATVLDLAPAVGFQSSGPLSALNNLGEYVGTDYGPQKPIRWSKQQGLEYLSVPAGAVGGASGINDVGDITGALLMGGTIRATRWAGGAYQDLHPAGYAESRALGIAQNGDIGGEVETTNAFHAGFWRNGTEFVDVGVLGPGQYTLFGDLNSHEQMVGQATFNGQFSAYFWEKGTLYHLPDLLNPKLDISFGNAQAINQSGFIVASGSLNGLTGRRFLLTPVPEHSTLFGVSAFLSLLLLTRWKRGVENYQKTQE